MLPCVAGGNNLASLIADSEKIGIPTGRAIRSIFRSPINPVGEAGEIGCTLATTSPRRGENQNSLPSFYSKIDTKPKKNLRRIMLSVQGAMRNRTTAVEKVREIACLTSTRGSLYCIRVIRQRRETLQSRACPTSQPCVWYIGA